METALRFPVLRYCNMCTNGTNELDSYRPTLPLLSLYFICIFFRQIQFPKLLKFYLQIAAYLLYIHSV